MRLKDCGATVREALLSLCQNRYEGPVSVRVRIDFDSSDATDSHVERAALKRPDWEWSIVRSPRHEDLWKATRIMYEELGEGVVYLLDGDNLLSEDRISRGWEVDPHRRLLCVQRVEWISNGGSHVGFVPINKTVPTSEELLELNRFDTLNQRLDARFAREVLAPLMALEEEEAVPDYFANLVAARLSIVCVHEYVGGKYRNRPRSLSQREGYPALDLRTRALFRRIEKSGELLERVGRLPAETLSATRVASLM